MNMNCTKDVVKALGLLLLLMMFPLGAFAQKSAVKGNVSDADGPIIGATVRPKGATTGTITDFDGNFTIDVAPSDVLQISYVGYQSQEIRVGNQKVINVVLKEDDKI